MEHLEDIVLRRSGTVDKTLKSNHKLTSVSKTVTTTIKDLRNVHSSICKTSSWLTWPCTVDRTEKIRLQTSSRKTIPQGPLGPDFTAMDFTAWLENLLAACCVPCAESMCDIRCGTCQRKTRVSRCLLCVWVGIRMCECYHAVSIVWLIAWWSLTKWGWGWGWFGGWVGGEGVGCTRTQPYRAMARTWLIHFFF